MSITQASARAPLFTAPGTVPSLKLALVGSGGDGVALLGDLVLTLAAERGLYGVMVQSYGPQIRGGESAALLRLAGSEVQYEGDEADVLVCFRTRDLARFQGTVKLREGSMVILDAADNDPLPGWLGPVPREPWRHPFARLENGIEVAGEPRNMMALALLCRALGWDPAPAEALLQRRFGSRADVFERNRAAFRRAWDASTDLPTLRVPAAGGRDLVIESGNEAAARGAMDAGLKFFAGYPITPSSEIMETLIDELPLSGGTVVQAEDEIAALGMVLGASFGGTPSMTATSGPGLSLMTEMLGLAGMAELPCVIVDCQRAGPATGMPSRTEQSDLDHATRGGHGDFPRAVLGVFDVVHQRTAMHKAFMLSEQYQLPVLVLSDAYVAQRRQICDPIPAPGPRPMRRLWQPGDGPARFQLGLEHGVSPFRVPGTPGGTYLAAGIEHTPEGHPTSDTDLHERMNDRRFSRMDGIAAATAGWYRVMGASNAPLGLIAWGSTYGLLREFVAAHPEFTVFMPEILHPLPMEALQDWISHREWSAAVELSYQGQFHRHLVGHLGFDVLASIRRSGGVPLSMRELERRLAEVRS